MADVSDEALVEQVRHNQDAYAVLVERYQHRIVTLAYRMLGNPDEAEDIAQETFIRAYVALPRFKTGLRWSPWIYKIATNLCLTALSRRRANYDRMVELTPDFDPADPADDPEQLLELREMQADVQRALLSLSPNYRAAVVLRHIEDLSYEEIAATLDVPVGMVKNWLFRARRQLQLRLRRDA